MHGWGWFERPTAALSFEWKKTYEQMVYEAILQASEYLNSERHDNTQD
jgi:hypothetical protein